MSNIAPSSSNQVNTNDQSQPSPQEPQPLTAKRVISFLSAMTLSIIVILAFFSFGSIFISKMNFYSRFKMNGRFDNVPPYTTKFPYKNIFTETTDSSWVYRFGRWLTKSIISAFANNRYILDMFLDYTGKVLKDSPGFISTIVLVLAPIIMIGLVIASFFMGFASTLLGALSNLEDVIPSFFEFVLLALPLFLPLLAYPFLILYSAGGLGLGVGIAQCLMMIGFFFILPFADAGVRQGIVNALVENSYIIMLCVFSVMTINAFRMLGKIPGFISLGLAIAALLTYIYMKVL